MALILVENISCNTQLGIWKKEESLDLLEGVYDLNASEIPEYQKITHVGRKCEWLTTRVLLTELLQQRTTIIYNSNGKPEILNNPRNITISHSKNFVAIIVSTNQIAGVDVEHIAPRVEAVKHKFLSITEQAWCSNLDQMTLCWSVKEAVFKIHEKELDFLDIEVPPVTMDEDTGNFSIRIIKKGKEGVYAAKYMRIENDILTYILTGNNLAVEL